MNYKKKPWDNSKYVRTLRMLLLMVAVHVVCVCVCELVVCLARYLIYPKPDRLADIIYFYPNWDTRNPNASPAIFIQYPKPEPPKIFIYIRLNHLATTVHVDLQNHCSSIVEQLSITIHVDKTASVSRCFYRSSEDENP